MLYNRYSFVLNIIYICIRIGTSHRYCTYYNIMCLYNIMTIKNFNNNLKKLPMSKNTFITYWTAGMFLREHYIIINILSIL